MTEKYAVKCTVTLTFICALLASGSTREAVRNPQSNNFNLWSCGEDQFTCQNGDCIASESLCDGRADCSDESDETQEECLKPWLTCPYFAFRCNYGACIDGDRTCNGVRDCADGSDEDLPRCGGPATPKPFTSCGREDQFTCRDGDCIASESLCDGRADCSDQSDETQEECLKPWLTCPYFAFRCNYGACIDGDLPCNGVRDCADGSDEDPLRCGGPTTPEPFTSWTPTPTRPPTDMGSSWVFPRSCEIPPQPSNGHWKLDRSQCSDELNCPNPQNGELDPGTRLQYTCDPNFKANGSTEVSCESTGRWSEIPVCVVHVDRIVDAFGSSAPRFRCLGPVHRGLRHPGRPLYDEFNLKRGVDIIEISPPIAVERSKCPSQTHPRTANCRRRCSLCGALGVKRKRSPKTDRGGWKMNSEAHFQMHVKTVRNTLTYLYHLCNWHNYISQLFIYHRNMIVAVRDLQKVVKSESKTSEMAYSCEAIINVSRYQICDIVSTNNIYLLLENGKIAAYVHLHAAIMPFPIRNNQFQTSTDRNRAKNKYIDSKVQNFNVPAKYVALGMMFRYHYTRSEVRFHDVHRFAKVSATMFIAETCYEPILQYLCLSPCLVALHIHNLHKYGRRRNFDRGRAVSNIPNTFLKDARLLPDTSTIIQAGTVRSESEPAQRAARGPKGSGPSDEVAAAGRFQESVYGVASTFSQANLKMDSFEGPIYVHVIIATDRAMDKKCAKNLYFQTFWLMDFVYSFITLLASGSTREAVRNPQSNNFNLWSCGEDQFTCQNGDCIASESLCDGRADCSDQSDETQEECLKPWLTCPDFAFRCIYGACIDGDRTCNGVRDCADGSDEDLPRCGGPATPEPFTSWAPTPTQPPTDMGSSWVFPRSCEIPPQPSNGHWKLDRSQCSDELNCPNPQNGELDPGTRLQYTCDPNFKANGSTQVYCESTGRWSEIPVCVEITCKSLESVSMITSCYRSTVWLPCGSSVLPNTTAELVCRAGYKKDSSLLDSGSKTVTCNTHGEWEPRPITCVPKCGTTNIRLTPTILNGESADVSEFPWHASLYKQSNNSLGTKEFKCGATIVRTNILLTAAHCVYDEISNMVETPESFHVVTGNKFRDYDSPLHDSRVVRKAAVKRIYIPVEFFGNDGNYGSDVAVIELREPFQLSDILMPICMNLDGLNNQLLEAGSVGRFAGYGGTNTASSSATLLTTNISYVSYKTCGLSMGSEENRKYLTVDKFCGEGQSGTAACPGDSGGGLVFQSAGKWHILGILSLRLNKNTMNVDKTCDSEAYALFTKVHAHLSWINRLISRINKHAD
ncbi:uncharacterized protein LOC124413665 [Diprion similis]|uniref:uncharacterized protein LOC124413665 n=1 Tax=Diprion similis TaxID=362088 RepID=UPI001EF8A693|nr:uncharacterized protein LOC124413665 [Diprion similis]